MKTVHGIIRQCTDSDYPELWRKDCLGSNLSEIVPTRTDSTSQLRKCLSYVDISKQPDIPLEEELVVVLDGHTVVSWRHSGPAALRHATRKDIALFKVIQPENEVTQADWDWIREHAKILQDETRRWSREQWDVTVTPYVYQPTEATSLKLRLFDWRALKTWLNKQYPDNTHNYWHLATLASHTGVCGRAWVNGSEAVSFCGSDTEHHEQGHNFGVSHAGTPAREYLQDNEWMGAGQGRNNHNAPMVKHLKLLDEQHVEKLFTDDEGVEAYLVQHDTPDIAVRDGELKLVEIATDNNRGADLGISLLGDRVAVHQPATRSWVKTQRLANLRKRESFTIHNVTVRFVESYDDQSVKVAIEKRGATQTVPKPSPLPVEGIEPWDKGGLWHSPDQTAQGLYVYPLKEQNRIVLAWMYWERQGYEQRWAVSDMTVNENNVASGDLIVVENGENKTIGGASLTFNEDGSSSFYAQSEQTLRWGVTLERLTIPDDHSLEGWWNLGNKQGLFVQVIGDRLVAHWLTRDISNKPWSRKETPRWYEIQGPVDEELTVYKIEGGMLGVKAETSITPVGIAYITEDGATILGTEYPTNKLA